MHGSRPFSGRAAYRLFRLFCLGLALPALLSASALFGTLRGVVHDPQHRPIAGARVTARALHSHWTRTVATNAAGEFTIPAAPLGDYAVTARAPGFAPLTQVVTVIAGGAPILHLPLALAAGKTTVEVAAAAPALGAQSSAAATLVSGAQIQTTPGANRANSLAMITDFVPGAYIVHDQLHIRGGHQVTWLLDGVPVPNTSIAANIGPQFNPADVEELEVQRGGYSAEYGGRTYGVFNVVTRSGFERNNEAELDASYGSFEQTNDVLNFGSHTDRFAYFASLSGNRSDLGLETPTPAALHDQDAGLGGFASLIYNADPKDQLRLVASLRHDHYQVPNTPAQQAAGASDRDQEDDSYFNFTWLRTFNPDVVLTVSPYFHANRATYLGGPNDAPVSPYDDLNTQYLGGAADLAALAGPHNLKFGAGGFAEHDESAFGLAGEGLSLLDQRAAWGGVEDAYAQDQFRLTRGLTLNAGLRLTHFAGVGESETAVDPRLGLALRLPVVHWVARAYYGRFYQPPPLTTIGGPLLDFALRQGFGFLSLRGERDAQRDFGLTIPWRGWSLDLDNFETRADNFFDHDVLGNSNIFLPLTIAHARIRGSEAALRSPLLARRGRVHLAYSHQFAQGLGGVTGGLTDFSPPASEYYFLDHDQRDTLRLGGLWNFDRATWADAEFNYGSGFLRGDGPAHLPGHATVDLSLGRSFGERWSLVGAGLNLADNHYLLDTSNTFGGTHYADPRELILEVRYRFHY